jgi:hypothetical protein
VKKLAAAVLLGCALMATGIAGASTGRSGSGARVAAAPPITYGVADDGGKYADDGGAWFNSELKGANLGEERWTLQYTGSPTTIAEKAFLDRAAPQAKLDGIKVELALYGSPDSGNTDPEGFCSWAAYVALYVQQWNIQDFIIWNEPNTGLYWKGAGSDATVPAKYEALLASCYDKIKVANPSAVVIGFGLSPRKGTPTQTAPIPFIAAVGAAYAASGRNKPIMDMISVHPYPNPNNPTDSPDVGYADTDNYGIPNLDRVKQAVYDAFNGTAQKTTVNGLMIVLDEVGWQTDTKKYSQYIHDENVKTVDEATQTKFLQLATAKYFACDPTIATVNWFLLADESTRDGKDASGNSVGGGWQSGLLTAGGKGVSTAKQAYTALASAWAAGRAACSGSMIQWTPKGGTGSGSGSGSGSGTGAAGGTTGTPTFDFSALDGILTADQINSLTWALWIMPISGDPVYNVSVWRSVVLPIVTKIEKALGTLKGDAVVTAVIVWSATNAQTFALRQLLTPSKRALNQASASPFVVLSKASAKVKSGKTIGLTLKPVKKAVGAGSLYLVLGVQSAADPSKSGYLTGKLGTIGGAAKAPLCKKGQKTTTKKPCRKK